MKLISSDKIPVKIHVFWYDWDKFEQDLPSVS